MKRRDLLWLLAVIPSAGAVLLVGWALSTMLSFRSGELLWLLALVPILVAVAIAAWLSRKRSTARFGSEANVHALTHGSPRAFRATRNVLIIVAFALTAITLAGPQYGSRTRILRKRGVDVVVALDFSKSMLARDVSPSRIERAKAELIRFINELDGDRIGIVAFAGETMEFPMTIDYAAANLFFRDLGPYDMPVGGTAIGRALVAAGRLIERSTPPPPPGERDPAPRSRVVVLITDGEDHEGDPLTAARELADKGVKIFVVGVGTATGEPIPTFAPDGTWTGYLRDDEGRPVTTALTSEIEATLRQIATNSGGQYIRAGRGRIGVEEIRRAMRRMKQQENRARRVTVHEDRYVFVLVPAFLLLLLEALLPDAWVGRRRRKPTPPPRRRQAALERAGHDRAGQNRANMTGDVAQKGEAA